MINKDTLYFYKFDEDIDNYFIGFIHSTDGTYFTGWSRNLGVFCKEGFEWEERVSHLHKFKPIGQKCILQWQ